MKRLLLFAVTVALAGTVAGLAGAQSPPAAVTRTIAALRQAGAPGVVVMVAKDGTPTLTIASGLADTKSRARAAAGDHFRVASITKMFVATVVLQLVGEGKLALSDTVQQRLPGLVPNGRRITIRELLQHTSGLYDFIDDPRVFNPYLSGHLGYTWSPRQLVKIAVSHHPLFAPGAKWSYSNTNYFLLGLIVEAVTKDTLGAELTRRILQPLGLHQTRFEAGTHVAAPTAHGYYNGQDVTGLSGSLYWAAGAMVSTAGDLVRFTSALFGGRLLRPHQLHEMETTVPIPYGSSAYGLGLIRVSTACGGAWGHKGNVPGYTSWALSSTDGKRQAIVLASSTEFPNPGVYEAAVDGLASTAFCS